MASKKTTTPKQEVPETEGQEPEMTVEQLEEMARAEEAKPLKAEKPQKNREAELAAEVERLKAQLAAGSKKSVMGDYERVMQASEECAAAGMSAWDMEIEVMVPHRERSEDPWYWVNVNGVSAQIPANDRYQKMKLPWACVLMDLLKAEKASADYQDSLEVYDPVVNPKK